MAKHRKKCAKTEGLKDCFESVAISLEREGLERTNAKAIGLHSLITEYKFVCTMLMLCDVLPHVSHLSRCFQIKDCDYSLVPRVLASTVCVLKTLETKPGPNLSQLETFLARVQAKKINIKKPPNVGNDYLSINIVKPYLQKLVKNLEDRFTDNSVMAAFNLFNPSTTCMPVSDEDLDEYGNNYVKELATHFQETGIVSDVDVCLSEWTHFRQFMRANLMQDTHQDVIKSLCCDATLAHVYPNLSTFAQICRVVPIASCDVERTFSQLKLIKSRVRNRMKEETLDSLLRIAIEGPPVQEFPVSEAVALWAKKKNRRLLHK